MSATAHLHHLAISDSGFVFDPRTGATFTLNASGLAVLTSLREGKKPQAIIARLREHFAEVPEGVNDDVADFIHSLQQHGLVPADAEMNDSPKAGSR